jgi:hypothetical protein
MLGRDVDFATLVEDALDDLEDFELRQQQPPLPEEPSYFAQLKGTLTHVLTIPLLAKEKATRALAAQYAAARRLLANRFVVYDFLERDVPLDTPIRYVVALARARALGAVPALLTSPLRALTSPIRAVSIPLRAVSPLLATPLRAARRRARRALGRVDGALFEDALPLHAPSTPVVNTPVPLAPAAPAAPAPAAPRPAPTWIEYASPQKKKRGLSARDPNVPPSPPKSPAKDYGPPLW